MEGSVRELSRYRLQQAEDDLETAKILLKERKYKASVNRSYYRIFHGLRAVATLKIIKAYINET